MTILCAESARHRARFNRAVEATVAALEDRPAPEAWPEDDGLQGGRMVTRRPHEVGGGLRLRREANPVSAFCRP